MATTQPYEILMRRNGQSWALQARSLTTLDDGSAIEGKAVPLAGLSDPAFAEVAELVGASKDNEIATLTAERDSLQSQLSAMTAERDALTTEKAALTTERDSLQSQVEALSAEKQGAEDAIAELSADLRTATAQLEAAVSERDGLQEQVTTLQARVDELTAIAEQPICTNFQIRAWLITKFGLGIIDKVTAMIASIPDATQRLLANQQWEYANNVLRDNPFVEQIAAALGMKSDEMDAAYLEASKIV